MTYSNDVMAQGEDGMNKYQDYKINQHNSTVCGYPGRDFDWSKFDWESKTEYSDKLVAIFTNNGIEASRKAPKPFVDKGLIGEGNEYLHVPYNWAEDATVYRVRPNDSMQSGHTYRGRLVKQTKALKKADGWYWRLVFEPSPSRPQPAGSAVGRTGGKVNAE